MADEPRDEGAGAKAAVVADVGSGRDPASGTRRATRARRVTLREVADAAGVSPSTVSRVLGGVTTSIPITEATRELVRTRARELGYRPHPLARGLQGSKTGLIGLVVRDLAYPLHGPLIEHVVEAVRARDHHVVIGASRGLASESNQLEHIIATRMCDGIVMIGGLDDRARIVDEIREARLPTVGVGLAITDDRIPVIRGDNGSGARQVFEHLAGLGHRRVGLIQSGIHVELQERADVFVAAAASAGWPADAVDRVIVENEPVEAAAALRAMLDRSRPSAVFVTTDHAAISVVAEAARLGIDVPGGLSVVGYDDLPMAATIHPPLTTVRQELHVLAERAVEAVFDIIRTGRTPPDIADPIPVSLVRRGSTAAPASAA